MQESTHFSSRQIYVHHHKERRKIKSAIILALFLLSVLLSTHIIKAAKSDSVEPLDYHSFTFTEPFNYKDGETDTSPPPTYDTVEYHADTSTGRMTLYAYHYSPIQQLFYGIADAGAIIGQIFQPPETQDYKVSMGVQMKGTCSVAGDDTFSAANLWYNVWDTCDSNNQDDWECLSNWKVVQILASPDSPISSVDQTYYPEARVHLLADHTYAVFANCNVGADGDGGNSEADFKDDGYCHLTYIHVESAVPNQPPVPKITIDDWSIVYILYGKPICKFQVMFHGYSSYDPDGEVVAWNWDFGDGSSATGSTYTHTYTRRGCYIVTLEVSDNYGLTAKTSKQVYVWTIPPIPLGGPPSDDPEPIQLLTPSGRAFSLPVTVGGDVVPADKFGLVWPYFGSVAIPLFAVLATTVSIKRIKRRNAR